MERTQSYCACWVLEKLGQTAGRTTSIRQPAVAGLFYPGDATELDAELERCLPPAPSVDVVAPRALIVPHAGYRYSGKIAGEGFAQLHGLSKPSVVFLLGPPHRVPVHGFALPGVRSFRTPLGEARLHDEIVEELQGRRHVIESEEAHRREHSLEVEVPFLQRLFGVDVPIVPLLVGDARPDVVAQLIDDYWDVPSALFLISSDLSHFLDYANAQVKDARTVEQILTLRRPDLTGEDACGCRAINGLIGFAAQRRLVPRLICLENSGDHGGGLDRVVGYASIGFWQEETRGGPCDS